jgi:hypothetical protein
MIGVFFVIIHGYRCFVTDLVAKSVGRESRPILTFITVGLTRTERMTLFQMMICRAWERQGDAEI